MSSFIPYPDTANGMGGFHYVGTINSSEFFIDNNREECPCCSCLNCANFNIIHDYETIVRTSHYSAVSL